MTDATSTTTIKNVLLIDPSCTDKEGSYIVSNVRFVGQNITEISSEPLQPVEGETVVDGSDHLLLPGFVNCHTHSSETWSRGAIPCLPLELWLCELIDSTPNDPEKAFWSAAHTAVETITTGGTTIMDHLSLMQGNEYETVASAVRAYRQVGARVFIAPLIHDLEVDDMVPHPNLSNPEPVPGRTEFNLELMERLVKDFHRPDEGINIAVGPTGIQLCSDALFVGCKELSEKYDLARHCHLLETKAQVKIAQMKYGCTAVEHLNKLGYLNNKTTCAHAVHLTEDDMKIMHKVGATIVHNPLSNLRLGSGISPLFKYRDNQVNIAIGCDGSASNDAQDVLEAIKISSMLNSVTDLDYRKWITPCEVLKMASQGGCRGVGLDQLAGEIAVGKKADIALYDLKRLSVLPRTDPIRMVVWGRSANVVKDVWVNGRAVVKGTKPTGIKIEDLEAKLWELSSWDLDKSREKQRRTEGLRSTIEPVYRAAMGLPE